MEKSMDAFEKIIEDAWNHKESITSSTQGSFKEAVLETLNLLDQGKISVSEKKEGVWRVNEWIKKAILLSFRLFPLTRFDTTPSPFYDKIPLKCASWNEDDFKKAGFRMVPGVIARHGAYIAPNVVLMPSFINIGASIGEGTMIDTWVTVGSCAHIGKNCHLSGGLGIGGVLEPLQAHPVIIEDNCFIGARSEIAEGVIVEEGAVIAMGTFISASTKIVNRSTGKITYGRIPAYSVVVPGSLPTSSPQGTSSPSLNCAVIIKTVDEKTRAKTSINDLLRM